MSVLRYGVVATMGELQIIVIGCHANVTDYERSYH